jgi:hypothetical protein
MEDIAFLFGNSHEGQVELLCPTLQYMVRLSVVKLQPESVAGRSTRNNATLLFTFNSREGE